MARGPGRPMNVRCLNVTRYRPAPPLTPRFVVRIGELLLECAAKWNLTKRTKGAGSILPIWQ
jgi:hypothetical protein